MDVDCDEDVVVKKVSKRNRRKRKAQSPAIEETPEARPEESNKRIKVSQSFLTDYGPQLNYSFNLWKKNSIVLNRATISDLSTGNPMEWSIEDVRRYVEQITSDSILASQFQEQEIDGAAFISMNNVDLVDLMKIKLGVAIKIYNRIMYLREEVMLNFIKI